MSLLSQRQLEQATCAASYFSFIVSTDVTCSRPEVDDDVSFVPSRNSYNVGNTVRFSCGRGSTLVGVETVECLPTGEWDNDFPTCQGKEIINLPIQLIPLSRSCSG